MILSLYCFSEFCLSFVFVCKWILFHALQIYCESKLVFSLKIKTQKIPSSKQKLMSTFRAFCAIKQFRQDSGQRLIYLMYLLCFFFFSFFLSFCFFYNYRILHVTYNTNHTNLRY